MMRLNETRLRNAANVIDERVQAGTHPCALAVVADRERIRWQHIANGSDQITEDTIFLLASITKPIVAVAVMQLVERGQLLLTKPVVEYLPEFTGGGKERVNTWHLLTHTSGLNEQKWAASRFGGQGEAGPCFEEACAAPLNFMPGERCEYCTLSFAVMAELITRLTGTPYPDYLRDHVFAPLGMKDTAFRPHDMTRAAPVHDFGTAVNLESLMSRAVAGGGLWSTASDLIAFGRAMLNVGMPNTTSVLSLAARDVMTRLHTGHLHTLLEEQPEPFMYALGWGKSTENVETLSSPASFGHGGATGTYLWIDPEWDLVYVFLTNRWGLETDTARRALNAVYGALDRVCGP